MLYRKNQKSIIDWITNSKKALLVTGARQTGKTFLIEETLKELNCDFVSFNLLNDKKLKDMIDNSILDNPIEIINKIVYFTDHKFIKGKTIIFFDEIQETKEIVTAIKALVNEGSYKYILSGSLLGVALKGIKSAPVGYMDTIQMYPLDFEEFLISLNIPNDSIIDLKKHFDNLEPVDEFVHNRLIDIFKNYLLIGGMPEAVNEYVKSFDYSKVEIIKQNIIDRYKDDFTKYEKDEKLKLLKTYDLIPYELSSKNKRYVFTDLDKNLRFERFENNFSWLAEAGVSIPVYNITEPRMPIELNVKSNLMKLFLSDVGLLMNYYGNSTKISILQNSPSLNAGAIYENVIAQELKSKGYDIFYFNSHKQGEVDFIIDYDDMVLPIEVKSGKDYTIHSALNNIMSNKDYNIKKSIVFTNYNIKVSDNIIYLPIYMIMFLKNRHDTDIKLDKIDLSDFKI